MFTNEEAKRIAEAYKIIYDAVLGTFCMRGGSNAHQDMLAAEQAASRIVAEKVGRGA